MSSGTHNMPSLADTGFSLQRHRKVVLVVDLVESVSLMQADELGVITRWQAFLQHVNQVVLPANEGRLVKSLGDGLMVEFEAVQQAAASAQAMHAWMADVCEPLQDGQALALRGGIHATDVYIDGTDIYGAGVNLAARMATLAGPYQTVLSAEAREHLVDGLDAEIQDLGERYLKHLTHPVRAFCINPMSRDEPERRPTDALTSQPVVAVMPFELRSGDAQHAVVGDLIADAVIHHLARSDLLVLSRLSSNALKGRSPGGTTIKRHLGARYVLTGMFHVSGNRLLIGAELSDTKDDSIMWTERITGAVDDLLDAESELAARIAEGAFSAIVQSGIRHARRQPPSALEDYSLLLGGIGLMYRQSRDDFTRARQLLEHLTERRPRFGMPRAWLGQWYAIGVSQGWLADPQVEAKRAMSEVDRALDHDPSLSLAMTIKGQVAGYLLKDFDAAESAYNMAIAENPNESLAWLFLATLNAWRGLGAKAKVAADRALILSPLHPARYYYESLAATAYLAAGDFAGSALLAEHSLKAHCLHTSTHKTLIAASTLAGNVERGREIAAALLRLEPQFTITGFIGRSPMANSPQLSSIVESLRVAGIPLN